MLLFFQCSLQKFSLSIKSYTPSMTLIPLKKYLNVNILPFAKFHGSYLAFSVLPPILEMTSANTMYLLTDRLKVNSHLNY